MVGNLYFDLTRELNAERCIALLASGQAVVFYRLALMSKDGDWILEESADACRKTLAVLAARGARYRPGAPLDPRWLAGGWSSHFEFFEASGRRIRCDFFTRPPRLEPAELATAFGAFGPGDLAVIDLVSLIRMKKTQRAKDYPIIGELARLLPPELELECSTDPDRILELANTRTQPSARPSVAAAREGKGRLAVVVALAVEVDQAQQADRAHVLAYQQASENYLRAFHEARTGELELYEGHARALQLAEEWLPERPWTEV